MKYTLLILALTLSFLGCKKDEDGDDNPVQPQAVDTWVKVYDYQPFDYAVQAVETVDGGFIVAGRENGSGSGIPYLLRLDNKGDSLWYHEYPTVPQVLIMDMISTTSGDVVLCGATSGDLAYAARMNSTGTAVWQRTYGTATGNQFSVAETSDGGFLLAGSVNNRFSVMKIRANGDSVFTRTIYDMNGSYGASIHRAPSGNYFVAGNHVGNVILATISETGELGWRQEFQDELLPWLTDFVILPDDHFILAGSTGTAGWICKVTPEGIREWSHTVENGITGFTRARLGPNGSLVLSGYAHPGSDSELLIYCLDQSGAQLWSRTYLTGLPEFADFVLPVSSGGYLLGGHIQNDNNTADLILLKLDQDGEL